MISLFQLNTCELGMLPLILGTLIPFLLGLLLGWILWAKWKKRFEDLSDEHNTLKQDFNQLTVERDEWISKHDQLASDLSIAESNLTRLRLEAKEVRAARDKIKLDYEKAQAELALVATSLVDKTVVKEESVTTANVTADKPTGTEPTVDLNQAAAVFGKKIKLDDLTLIEGIGPKIASLLNDEGIRSWRQLGKTNVGLIVDVLERNSLGSHIPTTWPKQAEMAANGQWAALLKWQDELDGGK